MRTGLAARRDWLEAMNLIAGSGAPVQRAGIGMPVLVVQDPEAARQVLVGDAASYERPWIVKNIMSEGLSHTLFTSEGHEWLTRRQRVAPVFGRAQVDGLARIIASAIDDQIGAWKPGRAEDMQRDLTDLTLRVACRALLGADSADDELGRVVRDRFEVLLAWISHRFSHLAAPPAAVPTPRNRAMRAAKADLKDAVDQLVRRRREAGATSTDVLSLLLADQAGGDGPSDADIVGECIGFLFAGHETTASTLTWALYELATHPDIQAEVAAEGARLDLGRPDLFDAVDQLSLIGRVADEILRLYPAGIGIARVAKTSTELCGHRVRRWTVILIAVYLIQRAPAWPDPHEFDPQREFPTQPAGAGGAGYPPFGWGPRRCLGARFATIETRLALAMICARWALTYEEPSPPRAGVMPSLRVDGALPLRLDRRV